MSQPGTPNPSPADVICAALEPGLKSGIAANRTARVLDALRAAGWRLIHQDAISADEAVAAHDFSGLTYDELQRRNLLARTRLVEAQLAELRADPDEVGANASVPVLAFDASAFTAACRTASEALAAIQIRTYDPRPDAPLPDFSNAGTFQARVWKHIEAVCEGDPTGLDERRDRFTEEALELIQACGGTLDGVAALARYVFGRAVGNRRQEFGGTTTTLASLASMAGEDLLACGEAELARTWEPDTFARIRRKRAARHGRGPLPGVDGDLVTSPASPLGIEIVALRDLALVLDAHLGDGALSDHGYDLVTAALARVYPEHVHTVERCGEPSCREHGCDECPTDAQRQAADNRLTAWLARNPCQGPTPSPVADGAAPFLESQDGDPLQLDETRPVATSAPPQVVSPSTGSGRAGA